MSTRTRACRTSVGSVASVAPARAANEPGGGDDSEEDDSDEDDKVICEICGQDLSAFRPNGRAQHRKWCRRKAEEKRKAEAAEKAKGKRPLPMPLPQQCPACQKRFGKGFNEANIRTHFKSQHGFDWRLGGPMPAAPSKKSKQTPINTFMVPKGRPQTSDTPAPSRTSRVDSAPRPTAVSLSPIDAEISPSEPVCDLTNGDPEGPVVCDLTNDPEGAVQTLQTPAVTNADAPGGHLASSSDGVPSTRTTSQCQLELLGVRLCSGLKLCTMQPTALGSVFQTPITMNYPFQRHASNSALLPFNVDTSGIARHRQCAKVLGAGEKGPACSPESG